MCIYIYTLKFVIKETQLIKEMPFEACKVKSYTRPEACKSVHQVPVGACNGEVCTPSLGRVRLRFVHPPWGV